MGDVALVIFTNGQKVSPTTYLHWNGEHVPKYLEELQSLMSDRVHDVDYVCARFVGLCHERVPGPLSLGSWNTPPLICNAIRNFKPDELRNELSDYTHHDAGVIVVQLPSLDWTAYHGYLEEKNNG